jgi:Pyridoxamine 5'-phosphate oxidase
MICDWQIEEGQKAELYRFMAGCRLGVLGSLSKGLSPQAALVGIAVTPRLEIIFDTVESSRKYGNLIAKPACSFVMGWEGEQTVQYEGVAEELERLSPELALYQKIYFEAWPECRAHLSWAGIRYFVVRPRWIRYSDYGRNPPLIREFSFGDGT